MLAVNAAAVLAGARSLAAIGEWASDALWQVLAAFGVGRDPLTRCCHVPGEATIRRVLAWVDGDAVDTTVGAWPADRLRPSAGDADARSPSTCSRQQAPRSPMNGGSRRGVWEEDVGMQFDHLMHWVPDLDAATRAYQALGFSIQPGGEHPGVGTRNAAWRIDARYVELITVHDQGVARAGFGPAWPAIDALLGAGGGGLAFAVLVSDVAASVAGLRARGVSVTDAQAGSLRQPDGSTVTWALAFLAEAPAWAPFLINYGVPAQEWRARFRGPGFPIDPWSLDHLVVEASDPAASARWLAGVLGLPVVQVGRGAVGVPLPGCTVAFAPGLANRVTRVMLAGVDAPVGEVAGLRYLRATP